MTRSQSPKVIRSLQTRAPGYYTDIRDDLGSRELKFEIQANTSVRAHSHPLEVEVAESKGSEMQKEILR